MARSKPAASMLILNMNYRMSLMGISDQEMAAAMRMSVKTLQNRRRHPEHFRLDQLELMEKKLKMSLDELRKVRE